MRKQIVDDITPRMVDARQGSRYTGRGETNFRKWAREIGAERRIGRLVKYDMRVIDAALDAMGPDEEIK